MSHSSDLLDVVVGELHRRRGDIPAVARASGIPYDTVHRIKNREGDPGYSKVQRLASALRIRIVGITVDADGAPAVPASPAAQEEARDAA